MQNAPVSGPLEGVTILDLSRVLAGPFATMTLAGLGARVIKVEVPGTGDDARAIGPFQDGRSLYFEGINFNKESIALDLKDETDRKTFEALLAKADVLVENFRPGVMDRLGLGWDELKERHPKLIYAAASGFGRSGPASDQPAYDLIVQAMSGMMSITGERGGAPVRAGVSVGDLTAGTYLCLGILAALFRRASTCRGELVDVAMLDCQIAFMEEPLTSYANTGVLPGPRGTRHPSIVPFQAYRTKDSQLVIAAGNDQLFAKLAGALGKPELPELEKFSSVRKRFEHVDELETVLEEALSERTTDDWIAELTAAGIPCGPIATVDQVLENPQVRARNMIRQTAPRQDGSRSTVIGNPIKFGSYPEQMEPLPAPQLDQHRESILAMLATQE
ncbi:CoA:oxalate CoA-transferase [Psychromicrobium silvestre]|uniref:CoA:oxalate CoA-transferase n=1 Tax=Psychromicrobium silvestre TaxID=1645614 RepID=A0A7Y9S7Q4_9MICC|nr:CoA transferase [Psychromicrobium silvestre]NYE95795.1 CoA:oxalate CoA-transferase [Psychromicrobium silvestre]